MMNEIRQKDETDQDRLEQWLRDSKMTPDAMDAFLQEAIEQEEAKPEEQQDFSKLAMYEKVLFRLRADRPLVTRKEEGRQKLEQYLREHPVSKPRMRMSRRLIIAFASLLLVVVGVEAFLHREWLFGKPPDDGQQYIIQGGKIDPNLIAEGQADPIPVTKRMTITNLDEAPVLLGFTPSYPTWLPEGWAFERAEIVWTEPYTTFVVAYKKKSESYFLRYEERVFKNSEYVRADIQQDSNSRMVFLNGMQVHIATNVEIPTCIWLSGLTYTAVIGPVSEPELLRIAESIVKEQRK